MFQFRMVQLKVGKSLTLGDFITFQFRMVQLKEYGADMAQKTFSVSIPHGPIKRRGDRR